MLPIPQNFADRMIEMHGDAGVAWLDRLPALIAECSRRWEVREVLPPFGLSYNYVAPAVRRDGTEVVLKLGYPHHELFTEMEALRVYDGQGIVQLLESDRDLGAMLLERLKPGTMLAAVQDDVEATAIAADVMRRLWRPAPDERAFPTIADWAKGMGRLRAEFDGGVGPFDQALVEQAETLFAELLSSQGPPVLLHGDLHHENIMRAERQPWLALDPKGIVGEAEYEVGALLRNQLPEPPVASEWRRILARRIDQLAEELDFDRERLRKWGMAQAVLSAWWSYEDHGYGWEWAMECAAAMRE